MWVDRRRQHPEARGYCWSFHTGGTAFASGATMCVVIPVAKRLEVEFGTLAAADTVVAADIVVAADTVLKAGTVVVNDVVVASQESGCLE